MIRLRAPSSLLWALAGLILVLMSVSMAIEGSFALAGSAYRQPEATLEQGAALQAAHHLLIEADPTQGIIFTADFESGGTAIWSDTVP